MLKKDVIQRFFSKFFCFFQNNKEVSIPNHHEPTYYEKYQTYRTTCNVNSYGKQSIIVIIELHFR